MDGALPLSALLSQALVAFTIEFDNESERRLPHRTTRHGPAGGSLHAPWLVSLAMWTNCMQHVGPDGVIVGELKRLARTETNLAGMERWGYITVTPAEARGKKKAPLSESLVRSTSAGRQAQEIWRPLLDVIEERWVDRFGRDQILQLRKALCALVSELDPGLPDCLPIVGYGLSTRAPERKLRNSANALRTQLARSAAPATDPSSLALPVLLSKVLLAFAIEFETAADVSLAISANILRLIETEGARVRDLARLSGVSKEAVATSLSFLTKRGYAVVGPESPGSSTKLVKLTPTGRRARETYQKLCSSIEEGWHTRFGKATTRDLRKALETLAGDSTAETSRLLEGLKPHPGNWRAALPDCAALPHFPLITHRGGFPDGS